MNYLTLLFFKEKFDKENRRSIVNLPKICLRFLL